ncbi:RHS repeat-associated core domain-containing protein [Methylosinus sp. PW1]|uniref:RHS repeat-associated core domain-containing protein n=1 Tax=Methylosinus sp. PW1 TaxID=107636 RepID=UPI000561995A|nr:RHS repeat-associated core domain-containing protein [Methylosinus sp. PW1]
MLQLANNYTNTGQIATATDANGDPLGRVTQFAYDALGRKLSVVNAAIQAAPLAAWTYTPDGVVASFTDANGHATAYTPDGFDRVRVTAYADSTSTTAGYDNDDNLLSFVTRKGDTLAYTYDTLNRRITKSGPGLPTVTYAYDLTDRLIAANDNSAAITTPQATPSYVASWAYDAADRSTGFVYGPSVTQTTPAAASVVFGHVYDAANRRITQSVSDNGWVAYPTAASQTAYVSNAVNQYTTVGAATPSYDGNGNLTFDGAVAYGYDAESRLTSASATSFTASYAYDARGVRKSKSVNGFATVTVTDESGRPLLDYDGSSGAVRQWMAQAGGAAGAVALLDPAGARRTLIPDIQGSVIASLDAGSGALTRQGYAPYGQTAGSFPFGYTGLRTDAETGLTNNHARLYHPVLGRFVQNDPIGYAGGYNLYAYVGNDPLNFTDPDGLVKDHPAAAAGIAAATIGTAVCVLLEPCGAIEGGLALAGGGAVATGATVSTTTVVAGAGIIGGTGIAVADLTVFNSSNAQGGSPDPGQPASAPFGRSGNPINVVPGTNAPASINGIDYTGHALDQMQGRGLTPSVVGNTIGQGTAYPTGTGTTGYYDAVNNVRVIINSVTGKVITVIPGAP